MWLRQQHHEGSPDSGTSKSLNFSNFLTFQNKNSDQFNVYFSYLIKMVVILKCKRAAVTLCEHFQAVAAKKSQPQPHRVNGPLKF